MVHSFYRILHMTAGECCSTPIYDVILYVLFRTLCILFLLLRCSELWILMHVAACQASFAHKATMEAARSLRFFFVRSLRSNPQRSQRLAHTNDSSYLVIVEDHPASQAVILVSLDTLGILSEVARAQGQLQEEACHGVPSSCVIENPLGSVLRSEYFAVSMIKWDIIVASPVVQCGSGNIP